MEKNTVMFFLFLFNVYILLITNNLQKQKSSWQKRAGHPEKIQGKAAL